MTTHVVMGDPHAKPSVSNERFYWAGRLIRDIKPDVFICMGDFGDIYSLNSYEKGQANLIKSANYRRDVEAELEAQELLYKGMGKKVAARTRMVLLGGNHDEGRITRALSANPHLEGTVSLQDLEYEYYWDYSPFLNKVRIGGITYSHYIKAGNAGKPMGGKNHANSLLNQEHVSTTVGHSHLLDYKIHSTGNGRPIHGLVAGCYFEHSEGYAYPNDKNWWRGIIVKRNVVKGDYSPQFIRFEDIRKEYKV